MGKSREIVETPWVESVQFMIPEGLPAQTCTQGRLQDNSESVAPRVLEEVARLVEVRGEMKGICCR